MVFLTYCGVFLLPKESPSDNSLISPQLPQELHTGLLSILQGRGCITPYDNLSFLLEQLWTVILVLWVRPVLCLFQGCFFLWLDQNLSFLMINGALHVTSIFEVVFADEVRKREHAPGYIMKENYCGVSLDSTQAQNFCGVSLAIHRWSMCSHAKC